ncbi:hypothetical protein QF034_003844 [Streptomyces africanus]|uniref:ATP-binding protein n=1 Tax=Streptomyces africanus TaxID=231024 RepID=A0ABU0QQE4_9ACTN|nr:hypothetical protein [Streptomyces africanus]MDQ0749613.1 hypothetical protein [Streptomyces africanus]
MCEELGFEKLLGEEGFFARLLGRAPSGAGRDLLYGPDLPVVLLTGGPGMGKGRLLRAVRDRFAAKVPVIHLDCASPVYEDRAAPEPGARSAATEALVEVARRLCTWQGTGGSFAFPRLFTGLAMIATGVAEGTPEAVATEAERYEDLAQKQRLRGLGVGDFWRGVLRGTIRNLLTTLGQALDPYSAAVSNALLDALFEGLAPRGRAELGRVYGAYPGAAGQPRIGLRILAADFRAGGEAREVAESFLFRALREDLEAAYAAPIGWLRRVGRPGLLLDHAESPLGEQLLRGVLTDRRGGQRDRVVIVGTARRPDGGAFLHGGLPPEEVTPPAEYRPADGPPPAWSRRTDQSADRAPLADGVLLLRMPLLTGDQLRRETVRRQQRAEPEGGTNRRRIDAAVARLSGGRPHTVIRLAEAAAAFRMPADANDRDILDAPLRLPGDGTLERPVADVLLRELILDQLPVRLPTEHHDHWLDLLTHLSVAHDTECADVLLRHHQRGHVHHLTAHHVARLLTDTGWPGCERHFIGDFGLRQLLVHRLYGLRPGGAAWYADHHLLRDHYARRAVGEAGGRGSGASDAASGGGALGGGVPGGRPPGDGSPGGAALGDGSPGVGVLGGAASRGEAPDGGASRGGAPDGGALPGGEPGAGAVHGGVPDGEASRQGSPDGGVLHGGVPDGEASRQGAPGDGPPVTGASPGGAWGSGSPGDGAFRSLTAHRMNHHLVSGGVDDVVTHLAVTLPGRPREWCAELLEIAQAPYPGGADARRERAQGLVPVDGPPLRRTVDQLLHAVWLCEERTRPTGKETARTLAKLLDLLSIMDFEGAGLLSRTATDWSGLAENEQPLLRCTCTEQLRRRR